MIKITYAVCIIAAGALCSLALYKIITGFPVIAPGEEALPDPARLADYHESTSASATVAAIASLSALLIVWMVLIAFHRPGFLRATPALLCSVVIILTALGVLKSSDDISMDPDVSFDTVASEIAVNAIGAGGPTATRLFLFLILGLVLPGTHHRSSNPGNESGGKGV